MQASLDERAQRVRLVEQHLHEQEQVDGVFEVSTDRVVAVTSERLMIVSGGGPRGWAQTSIPWRVVTAVQLGTEESDGMTTLGVEYNRSLPRMNRNGEGAVTSVRADLNPDSPEDAQRMTALINLRRAAAG
jgi:hypothetical protein